MQVSTTTISKTCRICFIETNNLITISNNEAEITYPDLIRKIRECGGIELRQEIGIPILICNNCIEHTKIAYKFRLQCQHSETRLKLLHEEFIQRSIQISPNQENLVETPNSPSESVYSSKLVIDEDYSNDDLDCTPSQRDEVKSVEKNNDGSSLSQDQLKLSDVENKREKKLNKRKYNRKLLKCPQCIEVFKSHETLAHHLFNSHGEKYKCLWCQEAFDTLKLMKSHKKTHDLKTRRQKQSCIKRENVDTSVSTINSIKNDNLKTCSKKNDVQDDATSNLSEKDKLIGKEDRQSDVEKNDDNKASTSDSVLTDMDTDKKEEKIESKVCHYKMRLKNFILHKCEICRRTFETMRQLNRHKRNHISKFVCNICNRAFGSPKKVDKHKKVDHSPDKNEIDESRVCFFCNKVFASSNRRFKHEKKVHWELEK